MNVLALDLAGITGFCFGNEAGVQAHGSFKLPMTGADYGRYLFHYRTWLSGAISRWQPDRIVYESPIMPGSANIHTLRKLYSLGPRTEEMAQDHGIKTGEANLLDIRRHFIGVGRTPKDIKCKPDCKVRICGHCRNARRAWIKEATVTMCRKRGFRPADDNAADALALFSFDMSTRIPNFELLGTEIVRAA